MKKYKLTEIVSPCDNCKGAKIIINENLAHALSRLESIKNLDLDELNRNAKNDPFIKCPKCNGEGLYEKEIDLQTAIQDLPLVEFIAENIFENSDFQNAMNDLIDDKLQVQSEAEARKNFKK